jgi:hypothetical protein
MIVLLFVDNVENTLSNNTVEIIIHASATSILYFISEAYALNTFINSLSPL